MTRPRTHARASTLFAALLCPLAWALVVGDTRDAHATGLVDLEVEPPNPQVGELFVVRYTVRIRNESSVQAAPLDFGRLEVLSDRSPPQMPFVGGFGGGGFMMSIDTAREYMVRANAPGRYRITNARLLDPQSGRVIAQHQGAIVTIGSAGALPPEPDAGLNAPPEPPPPPQDPDAPPLGDITGAEYNPNAFARIAVDNTRPYLGQQVILRVWLYVATAESGCEVSREPQTTGFWAEPLLPLARECAQRWFTQNVAGRVMAVGLVRKIALFPSTVGRVTIGGVTLGVDMATGGFFRQIQHFETRTPSLELEVREPPAAGRAADFVPGVSGPVTLTAELDRDALAVGETATITVRAQSEGSLASARVAVPTNVDGVRVRTGATNTHRDTTTGRAVTTLTTELLVVPERAGRFELGEVVLPYWDPVAERYGTARAQIPALTVTGAALPSDRAEARQDPAMVLSALSRDPALRAHRALFSRGALPLVTLVAPPVLLAFAAFAGTLARKTRARRKERDEARRADPDVLLADAKSARASNPREAASLAGRALDRAVASARAQLEEGAELPAEARAAIDEARAEANAARFAGEGETINIDALIAKVERVVRLLEEPG